MTLSPAAIAAQFQKCGLPAPKLARRGRGPQITLQDKWLARWQHWLPIFRANEEIGVCAIHFELCPVKNYVFAPPRKLEMDWAWPDLKCGVEIHGGQFMKRGGHNSPSGLARDCEKIRIAASLGWFLLPFCTSDVDEEKGFEELAKVLGDR